jgi:pimeloyl-ACP methyl ester carboxylesterase
MKLLTRFISIILLGVILLVLLIAILYGHRDLPLVQLKEKYAQSPSSFVPIDNMDVHYRDEGNLTDTLPIVLIHGTAASLHTFDDWTDELKNDYRVVRMDLPAFGLTGPFPHRQYTIENYVVFLEHFLSAKGINKCILGGNSLGGEIAWRFAAKNPELVDKLVLINAAGYQYESEREPIAFAIGRIPILNKLFTFITPRSVVQTSVESAYADKTKLSDVIVDRYFELSLREGNRQAFVDRMQIGPHNSPVHLIKEIQQPTLVLWGEQDYVIPSEMAYRFHEDLPNDSLVILKNIGHIPMEESPQESLIPLLSFLKNE